MSPSRDIDLKCKWDEIMETANQPDGTPPALATELDKIFDGIDRIGGDIDTYKRREGSQRTYKDASGATL
jgi:hypothetical protein